MSSRTSKRQLRRPQASRTIRPSEVTTMTWRFARRVGTVLDAACLVAGIARMRVHDLRHAHASLWLMAGGSLADVQRNLGHSTPVLTSETAISARTIGSRRWITACHWD
jgi:integrase